MVDRKKNSKICDKGSQEDLISKLPDDLISAKILCHFSTKEAVRTSVFSKKWRNLWQLVPGLELDLDACDFSDVNAFVSFADKFFDSLKESWIRKLRLRYNRQGDSSLLPWIDDVAVRRIQHLDVDVVADDCLVPYPPPDKIPSSIYTCERLVKLRLCESALVNAEFVSLPCLKMMHLENNFYPNAATLEKLISGAQVLEDLTIDNSITYRPRVIQVRSQTLKRIDISRCTYAVIDAPLLECLITKADQIKHYTITNSSFPAKLDIGVLSLFGQSEDVIRDILADIARVKDLVISSFLWKCMYQGLKSGAPLPPFRHLSCLNATFTIFDLEVLTTLLNNCPNLESLILELVKETSMFNMFRSDPKVKFSTVAGCLVSSLKFVELKSSISKYEIEMELVRYFLQNSPILEKLRVNSHYSGKAKSAILDQLLAMPRCSSACEILLLYTS